MLLAAIIASSLISMPDEISEARLAVLVKAAEQRSQAYRNQKATNAIVKTSQKPERSAVKGPQGSNAVVSPSQPASTDPRTPVDLFKKD